MKKKLAKINEMDISENFSSSQQADDGNIHGIINMFDANDDNNNNNDDDFGILILNILNKLNNF